MTVMFMATARDRRKTRVASMAAMMPIRIAVEAPKIESSSSARISEGMAMITSTIQASSRSAQPPTVPASRPVAAPTTKAMIVVISAMPMVLRAPQIRRLSMSRPRLSVPSQCASDQTSKGPATTSRSP